MPELIPVFLPLVLALGTASQIHRHFDIIIRSLQCPSVEEGLLYCTASLSVVFRYPRMLTVEGARKMQHLLMEVYHVSHHQKENDSNDTNVEKLAYEWLQIPMKVPVKTTELDGSLLSGVDAETLLTYVSPCTPSFRAHSVTFPSLRHFYSLPFWQDHPEALYGPLLLRLEQLGLKLLEQVEKHLCRLEKSHMSVNVSVALAENTSLSAALMSLDTVTTEAVQLLAQLIQTQSTPEGTPQARQRIFPSLKQALSRRVATKTLFPSGVSAVTSLLTFFLRHGDTLMVDVEPALRAFLLNEVPRSFFGPIFSFAALDFCTRHGQELQTLLPATLLPLLKIIAWHPSALCGEFLELLPAIIVPEYCTEQADALLLLPLTTLAMEKRLQADASAHLASKSLPSAAEQEYTSVLMNVDGDVWNAAAFLARNAYVGSGEHPYHSSSLPMATLRGMEELTRQYSNSHRAKAASRVALRCLNVLCDILVSMRRRELAAKTDLSQSAVVPAMEHTIQLILERLSMRSLDERYRADIAQLLADKLQCMFEVCPTLLISLKRTFLDCLKDAGSAVPFTILASLCFCVGEYSANLATNVGAASLSDYEEALEAFLHERLAFSRVHLRAFKAAQQGGSETSSNPPGGLLSASFSDNEESLVLLSLRAMARIAAVRSDLAARVSLFIMKFFSSATSGMSLRVQARVKELIQLLQSPSLSDAVLGNGLNDVSLFASRGKDSNSSLLYQLHGDTDPSPTSVPIHSFAMPAHR